MVWTANPYKMLVLSQEILEGPVLEVEKFLEKNGKNKYPRLKYRNVIYALYILCDLYFNTHLSIYYGLK